MMEFSKLRQSFGDQSPLLDGEATGALLVTPGITGSTAAANLRLLLEPS